MGYDEHLKSINPLPENVDWDELNTFLDNKITNHRNASDENYFNIYNDNWNTCYSFVNANLSENSVKVLECLHNDIKWFYDSFALKSVDEEVKALKILIQSKYVGLDKLKYINENGTFKIKTPYMEQVYRDYSCWRE